jgi:NTE family protein
MARTGLVLAGGGAKGAFEVGAIDWLINEHGVVPEVITGTSAGSISAAKLAEARTAPEFVRAVAELRRDLLAMTRFDVVFGRSPWLAEFDGTVIGDAVRSYVVEGRRPMEPPDPDGPLPPPPAVRKRRRRYSRFLDLVATTARAPRARRAMAGNLSSILTLEPLEAALRGTGDTDIGPLDVERIARDGLELRVSAVSLGTGMLRYVRQDGLIVQRDARTPVDGPGKGPVSIVDGVLASASVPMVFPPRPMAGDVYVDGGVFQNVPIQPALDLGADELYTVLAMPLDPPVEATDWTKENLVNIHVYATGVLPFFDRQKADLNTPMPDGATNRAIVPTLDVVGPFEVQQGLMLIDMDYGWLRAAETCSEIEPHIAERAVALTDRAISARERAWYLEERLFKREAPPDALSRLRRAKNEVREAIEERESLGLPAPEGAQAWWLEYESHEIARPASLPDTPAG